MFEASSNVGATSIWLTRSFTEIDLPKPGPAITIGM